MKESGNVDSLILQRRSIRLMTGNNITKEQLTQLFEAAKWAPSEYNSQCWRFLYCWRDTPEWDLFFPNIVEGNQKWASKASVLVVVLAKRFLDYKHKPSASYMFDVGAACQNLALQGAAMDLAVCCIGGFSPAQARKRLSIPDHFDLPAMIAIGEARPGIGARLKGVRKSVDEVVHEGSFPAIWADNLPKLPL